MMIEVSDFWRAGLTVIPRMDPSHCHARLIGSISQIDQFFHSSFCGWPVELSTSKILESQCSEGHERSSVPAATSKELVSVKLA